MAIADSGTTASPRIRARRQAIVDEALEHAATVLAVDGVGAVTVSEIARRMGMRAPSLYKYFPSLHAIYDTLFLRGNIEITAAVETAVRGTEPGLERILVASRAMLRWSYDNTGLAQLMFWRPVPGFRPTSESFQPSRAMWQRFRDDLATAVRAGELDLSADSDEGLRLLTIVIAGLLSQQMANDPESSFDDGAFTSLTDQALAMFVRHHAPSTKKGKT